MSETRLDPGWVYVKHADFPVNGQGTFILTSSDYMAYQMVVTSENLSKDDLEQCRLKGRYIALNIKGGGDDPAASFDISEEGGLRQLEFTKDDRARSQPDCQVAYWFSYDRDIMVLKYGKGYQMEETTLLTYDFLKDAKDAKDKEKVWKEYKSFFTAEIKKKVVVFGIPKLKGGLIDYTPLFQFRPNPLVGNYPALVKDSSTVTLFDLDRGQFMFSSSLPPACRELYGNIKNLILEYPENPVLKLSDAIRYSIVTEGKTLYKKLQDKKNEFSEDKEKEGNIKETYLRITLGPDVRTGPGVPYVLEIWPSGHYSPVHNHGNTCAIIKVLFGRITISLFNQQTSPPAEKPEFLKKFDAKEGDITWISPDWFQTHQLMSNTDDFCATIQCYRYTDDDTIHWPGFDHPSEGTDEEGHLDVFYPNSDFTFLQMRSLVMQEYQEYLSGSKNPKKTGSA